MSEAAPGLRPDSSPGARLLAQWHGQTRAGLDASLARQPLQARARHDEAARLACQLLALPTDGLTQVTDEDRIAAFVVAHLNLADSHADLGQQHAGARCLQGAHQHLLALMRDAQTPLSLQQAAARQLHHVLAAQSRLHVLDSSAPAAACPSQQASASADAPSRGPRLQ